MAQFVSSSQPVVMLGEYNQFTTDGEEATSLLALEPKLEPELRILCEDLRVLGKGDFKLLLKWRLRVRDAMQTHKQVAASDSEDRSDSEADEEQLEQDLFHEMKEIKDRAAARTKREKKKLKLRRMKSKARQIMGGETAVDLVDDMELFHLKNVRGSGAVDALVERQGQVRPRSRSDTQAPPVILLACAECLPVVQSADTLGSEESDGDSEPSSVESADEWSDAEDDGSGYERYTDTLDAELDAAFEQYSSLRAKESQSSQSAADGEEDLYAPVKSSDAAVARPAAASELIGSVPEAHTTKAANLWFQQPMFADMAGDDDSDMEDDDGSRLRNGALDRSDDGDDDDDDDDDDADEPASAASLNATQRSASKNGQEATARKRPRVSASQASASEFEDEPTTFASQHGTEGLSESDSESVDDDGYDSEEKAMVTALAPSMLRKKSREDLIDAGYNRYANNDDQSILPKWFVEDELKHHRPNLPITKEEAMRARAEARAINNRPIKKVAEAKARKKRKDSRRAEKVKAKAEAIAEADDVSAKAKMRAIEKLMKAQKQKKPDAVYVATEKGGGTKVVSKAKKGAGSGGRTVKVDRRMKADKRGKQAADRRKSNKGRARKRKKKR